MNEPISLGGEVLPQTIEECILDRPLKDTFNKIAESGEIPNTCYSLALQVLAKQQLPRHLCNMLDLDYIIINGSEEGNIDTLVGRSSSLRVLSRFKVASRL